MQFSVQKDVNYALVLVYQTLGYTPPTWIKFQISMLYHPPTPYQPILPGEYCHAIPYKKISAISKPIYFHHTIQIQADGWQLAEN